MSWPPNVVARSERMPRSDARTPVDRA